MQANVLGGFAMPRGRIVCIVFVCAICGCASHPPATTPDAVKARHTRMLTMNCFQNSAGWRAVYNDPEIFSACRRWAESQVR